MQQKISTLDRVNELLHEISSHKNSQKSIELGISLANELMLFLGTPLSLIKDPQDVLDMAYSNTEFKHQKMETWFKKHPFLGGARVALHHVQSPEFMVESKFYMLADELSKAKIAATANLFSNWEDSDLTKFSTYKVGMDFFLSGDGNKFYIVVTKSSNIRVLELEERLSNTQSEILLQLQDVFKYDGLDSSGQRQQNEPQQTIHSQLWNSLELSEVNKKFYQGVADLFEELTQHIRSKPPKELESRFNQKDAQLFSSRLIGRLIFIWFLRKNNIVHETMGYFSITDQSSTEYYESKLKSLFFETLNTSIDQRSNMDIVTPYLNGGLFEPHENDWFEFRVDFPKDWFQRLYEHFDKFNFTTDESTPEYEQVAIDPEMLGRVFENLLASVVPETANAANERKNKGAFYTPREIVSFMTKESIKQYLKNRISNEKYHMGIDRLIDMNDAQFLEQKSTGVSDIWGVSSKDVQLQIIKALDDIKILDPACGSGAFPIGVMQLMLQTYERVGAVYDKENSAHRLIKGSEPFDKYQTKLSIIRDNLYGSDIEPMAIEIARLRTWLSLIIEDMSHIDPLPNLDFNFVCANTLIPLESEKQISIFDDSDYEERLAILRDTFFATHDISRKLELKEKFEQIYSEKLNNSQENSKRVNQLGSWHPFDASHPSDFFDSEVMYNIKNFDVVIGNPPYIHLEDIKELSRDLYKPLGYKTYQARGDIYALFYEMGINILSEKGVLCFITSNKWMRASYGEELRDFFLRESNPLLLLDLGAGVFESATVDTNILIVEKSSYQKNATVLTLDSSIKRDKLTQEIQSRSFKTSFVIGSNWAILSPIEQSIKSKIEKYGIPLKDWPGVKINYGIKTGLNEAFIIDETKRQEILANCQTEEERLKTDQLIRPVIRGKDIKQNEINWAKLYLINTHNGYKLEDGTRVKAIDIEDYPSIKRHLDDFLPSLKKRTDRGTTPYNLRNCAYIEDFVKMKIAFPAIMSNQSSFVFDKEKYLVIAPGNIISGNALESIVLYLQTIGYFSLRKFYMGGGIEGELKTNRLGLLPVPNNIQKLDSFNKVCLELKLDESEVNLIEDFINIH
jgi:type I restriction-modification system DNA methylase subunit